MTIVIPGGSEANKKEILSR